MNKHNIAFSHTYLVVNRYSLKIIGFGTLKEARKIRDQVNKKALQQKWPHNPPCSIVVVREGELIDADKEEWRNERTHNPAADGKCSACLIFDEIHEIAPMNVNIISNESLEEIAKK